MGCITIENHLRIIRKVKRRALVIQLCGFLCTLSIISISLYFHLNRPIEVLEIEHLIPAELNSLLARHQLLTILRAKPLTIGQALDVAEVIMEQENVPVPLALGIIEQESAFRPGAVSHKGARGLMQIMPIVWENYLEQPELRVFENYIHEPAINVRVGLRCLSTLKKEFGDWRRALRAYVGGPKRADDAALNGYVDSVLLKTASYEKEIDRVWNRRDQDRYASQEEETNGNGKIESGDRRKARQLPDGPGLQSWTDQQGMGGS